MVSELFDPELLPSFLVFYSKFVGEVVLLVLVCVSKFHTERRGEDAKQQNGSVSERQNTEAN